MALEASALASALGIGVGRRLFDGGGGRSHPILRSPIELFAVGRVVLLAVADECRLGGARFAQRVRHVGEQVGGLERCTDRARNRQATARQAAALLPESGRVHLLHQQSSIECAAGRAGGHSQMLGHLKRRAGLELGLELGRHRRGHAGHGQLRRRQGLRGAVERRRGRACGGWRAAEVRFDEPAEHRVDLVVRRVQVRLLFAQRAVAAHVVVQRRLRQAAVAEAVRARKHDRHGQHVEADGARVVFEIRTGRGDGADDLGGDALRVREGRCEPARRCERLGLDEIEHGRRELDGRVLVVLLEELGDGERVEDGELAQHVDLRAEGEKGVERHLLRRRHVHALHHPLHEL